MILELRWCEEFWITAWELSAGSQWFDRVEAVVGGTNGIWCYTKFSHVGIASIQR